MLRVRFCRFPGVMRGVLQVTMRAMGVMACGFVVAILVVPGCFAVMAGRMLVMFGCLVVVFRRDFGHGRPPSRRAYTCRGREPRCAVLQEFERGVKL